MVALLIAALFLISILLDHFVFKYRKPQQIIVPICVQNIFFKRNILVVDDESIVCRSCKKILEAEGATVDMAMTVKTAISKLRIGNFDLVIVDWKMPEEDGMYLANRIKKEKLNIPVIMITGYPSLESSIQAMRSGISDYLPKPFTPDELKEITERILKQRKGKTAITNDGITKY